MSQCDFTGRRCDPGNMGCDEPECTHGARRSAPQASEWRPIESAPHNRSVLIWCEGWEGGAEAIWMWDDDDGHDVPGKEIGWYLANTHPTDGPGPDRQYPTRWMPLPGVPK